MPTTSIGGNWWGRESIYVEGSTVTVGNCSYSHGYLLPSPVTAVTSDTSWQLASSPPLSTLCFLPPSCLFPFFFSLICFLEVLKQYKLFVLSRTYWKLWYRSLSLLTLIPDKSQQLLRGIILRGRRGPGGKVWPVFLLGGPHIASLVPLSGSEIIF